MKTRACGAEEVFTPVPGLEVCSGQSEGWWMRSSALKLPGTDNSCSQSAQLMPELIACAAQEWELWNTAHTHCTLLSPCAVQGRTAVCDCRAAPGLRGELCWSQWTPCFQQITGTESTPNHSSWWVHLKPFPKILLLLPLPAVSQPSLSPEMTLCWSQ